MNQMKYASLACRALFSTSVVCGRQTSHKLPANPQVIAQRFFALGRFGSSLGHCPLPLQSYLHSTSRHVLDVSSLCGVPLLNICSQRSYMRKKTIKLPPTKPLNFDYGGDLNLDLKALDMNEPKPGYESVGTLQEADENIKRMFSLEFADGKAILRKRLDTILQEIQEHPADVRSYEVDIAVNTVRIRNQIRHQLAFRKDKFGKSQLVKRIWRRHKMLRLLQMKDIEKFNWLCDRLKLKYTPTPEYNKKLSKRAARKKAAREKMWAVKRQKMEDFKTKLAAQRAAFEEFKAKELAEIETILKKLGVTKLESVEQVIEDLGLGEPYVKKKEKRKTRRQQLLEMKFALYKNLPKYQNPS